MTAWGVNRLLLSDCRQVLADPLVRKWALLVGINQYATGPLRGCVADVDLQSNLLIHRFGFPSDQILRLTNQAATLQVINIAFTQRLQQVSASDVVVIHFSGYGQIEPNQQPGLLLAEGQSLTWDTLAQLVRSLPTQRVMTVLDTCYTTPSESPIQGNLRVRSRSSRLPDSGPAVVPWPGVTFAAAELAQVALEADWPGVSAGQFTYAWTQALWQMEPIRWSIALQQVIGKTGQTSRMYADPADSHRPKTIESGLMADARPAATAIATRVHGTGMMSEVWLGGLAAETLEAIASQSLLQTNSGVKLEVLERQGLEAKVRVVNGQAALVPGDPLREKQRMIPKHLELKVALDDNLTKIERVDAVGALSNLPQVATALAGEGHADYLLARVTPEAVTEVALLPDVPVTNVLPAGIAQVRYQLFLPDKRVAIGEVSDPGDAIKSAIQHLQPVLEALQAAKLLQLLHNPDCSELPILAQLEILDPKPRDLLQQGTQGAISLSHERGELWSADRPVIAAGSRLRYQLTNQSGDPCYWLLMGWDHRYSPYVVLPPMSHPASVILPKTSLPLPMGSSPDWILQSPPGWAEVYLVCSPAPFSHTYATLAHQTGGPVFYARPRPLQLAQALVEDLQQLSRESGNGGAPDAYALDVGTYAALRLRYQVATVQ